MSKVQAKIEDHSEIEAKLVLENKQWEQLTLYPRKPQNDNFKDVLKLSSSPVYGGWHS